MKHLVLRQIEYSDLDSLSLHLNNMNVTRFTNFPFPFTNNDALEFINKTQLNPERYRAIALDTSNLLIGAIGIVSIEVEMAEIGYWLSESYWNHGIMYTSLDNFISQHVKVYFPLIKRLIARVVTENDSSTKLLSKLGFQLQRIEKQAFAKNGVLYDDRVFEKTL